MSLTPKGMTTGEVSAHFADVYGATVSKDTISRITDEVVEEMAEWRDRPLDRGRFLAVVAHQLVVQVVKKCVIDVLGGLVIEDQQWSFIELEGDSVQVFGGVHLEVGVFEKYWRTIPFMFWSPGP